MSRTAIASVVAGSLIALGGGARADAVMDWNNLAAVISESDGMAQPEPATKWSPKEDAEEIVAVAAAGHSALVSMFPERKAVFDDDFAVMLADARAGPARAAGIEVGERAAAQVIGWRTADHSPSAPSIRIAAPPGHWVPTTPNKIPAYYATAKAWLLSTEDADIAMVDGKLTYSFWRPITAIRNGDQDGNAATERDADWEPLLKTPMHPEYPCGHCVVISALTTVLAAEGPPPPGGIAVMSEAMPGVVRYVESWPKLAEEVSLSRIYAGAHFRHSMEVGADLGKRVAEYELKGFLRPVR